jgi:DNA polymerase-3 subunit delta'
MPFRTIAGHGRIVSMLSRAIARDTLPPALLLAGPSGVGKRRVAVAVAEAVNCLRPRATPAFERDACGECVPCRRIARGVHPDVVIVEPGETGSILIDQIRDVVDRSGYRPFEGRRRVVIVDEADALVQPAQGALLKTLEEPPSASMFLLVSSQADSLLPTVRSRCPRLRFAALPAADVARVLRSEHGYSEGDAHAAAAEAGGSIGRALAGGESGRADARNWAERLLEKAARGGEPGWRLGHAREGVKRDATLNEQRDLLAGRLRALGSLARDLGVVSSGADTRTLANADLHAALKKLAASYDARRSASVFEAADLALDAVGRNANPKIVGDWIVMQI